MGKFSKLIKLRRYVRTTRRGLKKGFDDPEGLLNDITKTLAVGYLLWWGLWTLVALVLLYLLGFTDVLFGVGPLGFFALLFYVAAAVVVIVASWVIFIWVKLRKLARNLRERLDKHRARDVDHIDVEVIDDENEHN